MRALGGMLTYGLFLAFIILVIKKIRVRRIENLILFVSISFGLLAFFQNVSEYSDLSEAFGYLNGIRQNGFNYFSSDHYTIQNYFSGKIGLQIYFFICSLFPYNNFYSAIAMTITYFFVLKAIQYAADYYGIKTSLLKNLIILSLLSIDFYDASNGVRNMFAFSIFIYGLSLDIFKGRKIISLALYISAITIHPSTAVLVLLRYLQFIKKNYLKTIIGLILVLWSGGISGIANLLFPFRSIEAVSSIYDKLIYYSMLEGTNENFAEGFNTSASYMTMRGFRIFWVVLVIFAAILILKNQEKKKSIATFSLYVGSFSLGTLAPILATNVFTRYTFGIIMVTPMLLSEYLSSNCPKKYIRIGSMVTDAVIFGFAIALVLFNYYMFLYHYSSFGLTFELYS